MALRTAGLAAMLIGERSGLSAPDSAGAYLTWRPHAGTTNADRNCIFNIRPEGINHDAVVFKLAHLICEPCARDLSVYASRMALIDCWSVRDVNIS